jgi:hypothetical protein
MYAKRHEQARPPHLRERGAHFIFYGAIEIALTLLVISTPESGRAPSRASQ